MDHGMIGTPACLVKIKTIFFETGQIDNAKIGAAREIVGGGLSQIVPAAPNKSATYVRVLIFGSKDLVCRRPKIYCIGFIGTD
jgi:hypothetical protein